MDHPFRTAAVGGFNRQDVLTYLETVTKEAAEQREQLQQQLDEVNNSFSRQQEDMDKLRDQLEAIRQEKDKLSAQLEQARQELTASRSQCSESGGELDEAHREADELKKQNDELKQLVEKLRPSAEAYEAVKDRTAGMELEAHRRAQNVQEAAAAQVRETHRQAELWMQRLEREYSALRSQVEATVAHAADQLVRAGSSLDQVKVLMNEQEMALKSLSEFEAEQTE